MAKVHPNAVISDQAELADDVGSDRDRRVALQAAHESITLLRNDTTDTDSDGVPRPSRVPSGSARRSGTGGWRREEGRR